MKTALPLLFVSLFALADCSREGPREPLPAIESASIYHVPITDLPAVGDDAALVTVVAFTDYECPYCRKADASFTRMRGEVGTDLRMVFANHPLPMHAHARAAALAVLAAGEQGKYGPMSDRLFAEPTLDDAAFVRAAVALGLDVDAFNADRASGRLATALERAEDLARRFDVRGTPCFFINGRRVNGAQPYADLRRIVDEEIGRARVLVKSGVRRASVYDAIVAKGLDTATDDSAIEGACGARGCGGAPEFGAAVENVPIDRAPSHGSANAPITIVVFDDFECPFCVRAEQTIHAFESAHPNVRIVFKNHPLPMHDHARLAARAALAADAQGRFWEYHDVLFSHHDALDRPSLVRYASDLGLDMKQFERDLDDPRTDARIEADEADARALEVKGTPTFFVNGHRVIGAQPLGTFEAAAR